MLYIRKKEGPESCVRNISVEQLNISVRYEIHLDQQCSLGTSHLWTFHVVSCDTDEKLLEVYSTTELVDLMCPINDGCKRLQLGNVLSPPFNTSGTKPKVKIYFYTFNHKSLEMRITSEPWVKTWTLTVIRCQPKATWPSDECPSYNVDNVGNSTHLGHQGHFDLNCCYFFRLQPVSSIPQCTLQVSDMHFPSECYTPSPTPSTTPLPPPEGFSWIYWAVVVAVGLAAIQGVLLAAWYLRYKATPSSTKPCHQWEEKKQSMEHHLQLVVQQLPVMLVYAHDVSDLQLTLLTTWLTDHLRCQVHNLYNTNETVERTVDPYQWLLTMLSSSSVSVRVVLVMSPALNTIQKAVVEGRGDQVVDGVPPGDRFHTSLLTATLKRLQQQDLVRNYRRVFIVSLDETEMVAMQFENPQMVNPQLKNPQMVNPQEGYAESQMESELDGNMDLLVEHMRYCFPRHQQQLAAALLQH
ncbi:uncharacterized protein [Cherax quadricarinatus]|uniref:uncharacterized protein isoform X2 n=1 Tax=Cherax quadricarinatus TaxID=27406 RepID=UPI00387E5D44